MRETRRWQPSSAGARNNRGQLGRGDTQNTGISATYPANVQLVQLGGSGGGTGTASSVFASGFRTCAMVTGRGLVCWGYNTAGQLGYSNTTAQCNASGLAPSGLGVVSFGSLTLSSLAIAPEFSCALLSDGNVRCWGLDSMVNSVWGERFHRWATSVERPQRLPTSTATP